MTTFNSGDYVRTSKGNIGVIESPERWIIDSYGIIVFTSAYEHEVDDYITFYSNNNDVKSKIPNQVRLGNKTFPIWSDKLTKLDVLTIRKQQSFPQHDITLPVEDAKLLMEIYTRNKIWFQII